MTLDIVAAGATRLGIPLRAEQLDQLARFVALLLARNQELNLTRIVDPAEIERRHLLDSLTCALPVLNQQPHPQPLPIAMERGEAPECLSSAMEMGEARTSLPSRWRCLDVGSGGGLPGIPLAIAFPGLRVTLLESAGKKAAFLREVVDTLGLTDVSVKTGRAEELAAQTDHRDAYDLVVARALAPLPVALEWCLPFARPGGVVVLPRGSDLAAQLPDGSWAAGQLSARLRPPVPLDDPELPDGRALVVADKLGPTPARYPRRPGMASKRPLTSG